MKAFKILILSLAFFPIVVLAQENEPTADEMQMKNSRISDDGDSTTAWEYVKDRIFFGGTGGASFGSYTFINLSPIVGLRITPKFSTGLGGTYVYINDKRYNLSYSTSIYGGRVFSRYYFLEKFIAHGEFELLNGEILNQDGIVERKWFPALPVGGGIRQPIGDRSHVEVLLLLDLLHKPSTSLYYSPIRLNFGIVF